jgi:prevent-host-death family protein
MSSEYSGAMRTIPSNDAAHRFPELLEAARRAPVTVVDQGRPAAIVISIDEYERLRGVAWDRLAETMALAGRQAQVRGLTDELLESLLADEA